MTGAFALWNPPLRDLAAHTFRAEYFEQHGFAIWNGTWYGGHYLPAYSVLFPPLAALLSPVWVGAASAVASAHLFDGLVRARWGERGALGGAVVRGARRGRAARERLARVRARHRVRARRRCARCSSDAAGWRSLLAVGAALSSPVAAVFLALVAAVGGLAAGRGGAWRRSRVAALVPLAVLGLLFPEGGEFPFWFSAWWPLALFCGLALLAMRGVEARARRARGAGRRTSRSRRSLAWSRARWAAT